MVKNKGMNIQYIAGGFILAILLVYMGVIPMETKKEATTVSYSENVGGIQLKGTKLTAIEKEMKITNNYVCADYAKKTGHVLVGKLTMDNIPYSKAYWNVKKLTYVFCDLDSYPGSVASKKVMVVDKYFYEIAKDWSKGRLIIK